MICLACHKAIDNGTTMYHEACLKEFWQDNESVLQLEYGTSEIDKLAKENVAQRLIVTGVQPKLSLGYNNEAANDKRLTIVGALNGRFILKPPFALHPEMPQIEALSMHLAKACGVDTVPFLLIPLKDGELAYLTRRIDRKADGSKLAMEDACQFTQRLTEHKYRGSYEQIAKSIKTYGYNPLIDIIRFYEQVIVSFLIGNNDMHLKNFSLIAEAPGNYSLTPVYDMIAAQLLVDDPEELALNINGKKNRIGRSDFDGAIEGSGIPKKAIQNIWKRIETGMTEWEQLINNSFLSNDKKEEFKELIAKKAKQINLKF
ncbi:MULTISPECIES: HipA domain-containing protein [Bizionia]|uniref:HipA domain-containing protein n=1 Tax=Bizionia algoritergicola TaxID=291187 RepID=A0A5D0QS33_9FLAO|nr:MULTISPECIES: HipA domain-containing protein [Bizionia]OBX19008.1 phosphatidylinositol kinase [Bizionia sp. APA-3]TYB71962.1 HipA domain-containing protein [Bizionia algoritergicola]